MTYDFFLSYTRANNDAFLKKFFEELSQAIRDIRGSQLTDVVGFFDQRDLELGEDWDSAIVEALQSSSVLLSVASPAYFKSDYCGREWELFRQRLAAHAFPLPPLLKSVVWIPFNMATLPPPVAAGQLVLGDPQAIQNVEGFKSLLKNFAEHEIAFNKLIKGLAREIVNAADAHKDVKPLAPAPTLSETPSAFTRPQPWAGAATPSPTGPKHVRFVYVAADPSAPGFGAARSRDAYVDSGGADWKPFYPDDKNRIHQVVQYFVSSPELGFTSEELKFGPNLIADIKDAWNKRQIVVLIVDGWSVRWDQQYRSVLTDLDGRLDVHWCVLVPWNDKDADALAVRAEIDVAIGQTFDRHASLSPNPLFYRANITSAPELLKNLGDVLVKLKEEVKKRADVVMPVPAGPSRTVVRGPGAQG